MHNPNAPPLTSITLRKHKGAAYDSPQAVFVIKNNLINGIAGGR